MKRLFALLLLFPCALLGQTIPNVPTPAALFTSLTGAAGTWTPMLVSGGTTIPNVPQNIFGAYCSTDGTGNAGTWAPCKGSGSSVPNCSAGVGNKVELTGQTAAIGTTNMCTTTVAGTYRISAAIYISAVGTAGTITATVSANNGFANTTGSPSAVSATGLGFQTQAIFVYHVAAGQTINYATAFNSVTGTPAYGLDVVVEQLQ